MIVEKNIHTTIDEGQFFLRKEQKKRLVHSTLIIIIKFSWRSENFNLILAGANILQVGPCGRGQYFFEFAIRVEFLYKKFIQPYGPPCINGRNEECFLRRDTNDPFLPFPPTNEMFPVGKPRQALELSPLQGLCNATSQCVATSFPDKQSKVFENNFSSFREDTEEEAATTRSYEFVRPSIRP